MCTVDADNEARGGEGTQVHSPGGDADDGSSQVLRPRLVYFEEWLYTLCFISGVGLYLYSTTQTETIEVADDASAQAVSVGENDAWAANVSALSSPSSSSSAMVKRSDRLEHINVLAWILLSANCLSAAARLACWRRNIDSRVMRSLLTDPVVISLCVFGFLYLMLDFLSPVLTSSTYLTSKIGVLIEAFTILFADAVTLINHDVLIFSTCACSP